jgi:hypothetical protein
MTAATRRAGFLAAGLAWLFGLGHLAWAGGIAVLGATPEQFEKTGQGSASHLATETAIGSVALAGGPLALALVQPWGSAVPRRLLRAAAWAGAAVAVPAAAYGIIGVAEQALATAGRYQFPAGHAATAPGWWFFWYALFAAAGSTFTATVWLTRRSHTPHPPGPVRKRSDGAGNPPGTPPPPARPSGHPRPTGCGPATRDTDGLPGIPRSPGIRGAEGHLGAGRNAGAARSRAVPRHRTRLVGRTTVRRHR